MLRQTFKLPEAGQVAGGGRRQSKRPHHTTLKEKPEGLQKGAVKTLKKGGKKIPSQVR